MRYKRQKQIYNFGLIQKCRYSHYLCGPICPTANPFPSRLQKLVLPNVLSLPFIHRYHRDILSKYSEFLYWGGSIDIHFSSLSLSLAEKLLLKVAETICSELPSARKRKKPLESFFALWNDDFSVQDSWKKWPKILISRTAWEWGFWVWPHNCSTMSVNQMATQNVQALHKKKQCDEIGICYSAMLMTSQMNVGTYGSQPVDNL